MNSVNRLDVDLCACEIMETLQGLLGQDLEPNEDLYDCLKLIEGTLIKYKVRVKE